MNNETEDKSVITNLSSQLNLMHEYEGILEHTGFPLRTISINSNFLHSIQNFMGLHTFYSIKLNDSENSLELNCSRDEFIRLRNMINFLLDFYKTEGT